MSRAPLSHLKQEAVALAAEIGTLSTQARAASLAQLGSASRRRSGTGEQFWQYRRHTSEDGAERIDWRRSAREEHLYVRETELETARIFYFWADPSEGFAWGSAEALPSKSDRALVMAMSLAGALARSGERCGALGGGRPAVSGSRALSRVGEDLRDLKPGSGPPAAPRESSAVVIASDFYAPMETWRDSLGPVAAKCRDGVLLQIHDPVEASFPFEGRVRLYRPGENRERLLGRAEGLREAYLERFSRRQIDLTDLAREYGWRHVVHDTSADPLTTLREVGYLLGLSGAAR